MEKHYDRDEKRKEYERTLDEIIDDEEDYFDVRKMEQRNPKKQNPGIRKYNKENPYR